MTVTIGARWQVTLAVQEVASAVARMRRPVRRSWFAPPSAEEVAARQAMHETLTRERAQWTRNAALHLGGMA